MDDTKVLAAIIAGITSLILGVINIGMTLLKHKKDKEILKKQELFQKDIEELKTTNEINILRFKNELSDEKSKTTEELDRKNSILQSLQLVKDSMRYFKNISKMNNDVLLNEDINQLNKTVFGYMNSYKTYYMNMDEYEKEMIHDLKNYLHEIITKLEVKQRLNQIADSNIEIHVMVMNAIEHINLIQKDLLAYYEKR